MAGNRRDARAPLGVLAVKVEELLVAFADESDNEGGPAGLVGSSEAFARFGVKIFVEEEMFIPKRVATMRMMHSHEMP